MAIGTARRQVITVFAGATAIALATLIGGMVHAADSQGDSGAAIGGKATGPSDQSAPANKPIPDVAQRAVLYEEDPSNPLGRKFVGSVLWRTETVSANSGNPQEIAARADITIPDRGMIVTLSLRRNSDRTLPASHVIEIRFNLEPQFPGGGIANVPGFLTKDSEQSRGKPLVGLTAKVTSGSFTIGLSAVDSDRLRNLQLLKDEGWFDIPMYYSSGERAILAIQKGQTGVRAFTDAFAAWGQ